MEEFFKAVANLGFPVAVASYLLFRFEKKLEKLEESISGHKGLISSIEHLQEEIKGMGK